MRKPLVLFLIYRKLRDRNLEEVLEKPEDVGRCAEMEHLRLASGYVGESASSCQVPAVVKQLMAANDHTVLEFA